MKIFIGILVVMFVIVLIEIIKSPTMPDDFED